MTPTSLFLRLGVACTALAVLASTLQAQSPLDAAAKAEDARRATITQPAKVLTIRDLPAAVAPTPAAAPSSSDLADPARQEALASLRAVQSVLAGGANTGEFKKYYLEAKVKVDALAPTPGNAALRDVSAIYADAVTLFIASQTERLSATETRAIREKYAYDASFPFETVFRSVPSDGFGYTVGSKYEQQIAAIGAKSGGQMLLGLAEQKLNALQ